MTQTNANQPLLSSTEDLVAFCRDLLEVIEPAEGNHDEKATWVLPLRHLSYRLLKGALEVIKGEDVRIKGTPSTVVIAGPSADVHALGEMILALDQPGALAAS